MRGVVTDKDLDSAEKCFPGISGFYRSMTRKPQTFLELVWAYEAAQHRTMSRAA